MKIRSSSSGSTPRVSRFMESEGTRSGLPVPMIDWFSGYYSIQDPEGKRMNPADLPGVRGAIRVRVDPETGEEIDTGFDARRFGPLEGVDAFSVRTQIKGGMVQVSGNLTKFIQGHTLFSRLGPWETVDAWEADILRRWGIPDHRLILERATRMDLTHGVDCNSRDCCQSTLDALRAGWSAPRKPLSTESCTIYLGKKSKSLAGWTLKAYQKNLDRSKGAPSQDQPDISEFLRLELTLRTGGMRLAGLDPTKPRSWDLGAIYADFLGRCRLSPENGTQGVRVPPEGLSASDIGHWYQWTEGKALKGSLPESTFFAVRKRLLAHGVDISRPCTRGDVQRVHPLTWEQICDPSRWHATSFTQAHVARARNLREAEGAHRGNAAG